LDLDLNLGLLGKRHGDESLLDFHHGALNTNEVAFAVFVCLPDTGYLLLGLVMEIETESGLTEAGGIDADVRETRDMYYVVADANKACHL